jgi:hypothetical protein
LDLAKNVFQAHAADASGAVVFRKRLRRHQVLSFFAAQPRCLVAMEACAGAHYCGREIGKLGYEVRLIAPAYVRPFVRRQKNDAADAAAICEAAQRPTMRFVAVKSEGKQASAVIFRTRDILVGQRTQIINAIRGHLGEYGIIAPQEPSHIEQLIGQIEDADSDIPNAAFDVEPAFGAVSLHCTYSVFTHRPIVRGKPTPSTTPRGFIDLPQAPQSFSCVKPASTSVAARLARKLT